jgi:hypothetical protein
VSPPALRPSLAAASTGAAARRDNSLDDFSGGDFGDGGVQILDVQGHVVDHEDEDVFDGVAAMLGDQGHVPGQVAFGGDQGVELGHRVGDGDDRALAQLAQLVQQGQRAGAIDQGVGRQAELDAPAVQAGLRRRLGGGRLAGGLDDAAQVGQQGVAGRFGGGAALGQGAHVILAGQDGADQLGGGGDLALADAVEGGFAVVGEGGQGVEAEHGPRPLQGVETAEHRVDQVSIPGTMGQIEQTLLDLLQQVLGFLTERLDGIEAAHLARTFLTTRTSCSGSKVGEATVKRRATTPWRRTPIGRRHKTGSPWPP